MALHNDEHVARGVLCADIPRRFRATSLTSDLQTLALPERVERKAAVRAQAHAVDGLDRPGTIAQELSEEVAEGTLANEADPGAVGLIENRQTGASRSFSNLGLVDFA